MVFAETKDQQGLIKNYLKKTKKYMKKSFKHEMCCQLRESAVAIPRPGSVLDATNRLPVSEDKD